MNNLTWYRLANIWVIVFAIGFSSLLAYDKPYFWGVIGINFLIFLPFVAIIEQEGEKKIKGY